MFNSFDVLRTDLLHWLKLSGLLGLNVLVAVQNKVFVAAGPLTLKGADKTP
jgi:hypothetical protein